MIALLVQLPLYLRLRLINFVVMKSALIRFTLLVLFGLSTSTIFAQDTLSRGAWVEKVYALVYDNAGLSSEDEIWVKEAMKVMCDCTWVEPKEKRMECGEEFMKKEKLPITEEEFNAMTPDQERKFTLLNPLFSVMGKCPE
ncbi:MAG: hypothetical protein ACI81P_003114 [Neolewinella sp.]